MIELEAPGQGQHIYAEVPVGGPYWPGSIIHPTPVQHSLSLMHIVWFGSLRKPPLTEGVSIGALGFLPLPLLLVEIFDWILPAV